MKQLHVKEPWTDVAYRSNNQVFEDLVYRIQVLEGRVRDLELQAEVAIPAPSASRRESVSAGV